ncbi:helicase-related protein [Pseudomonas monteilii]|uniref:helicase-related protein n=1 Tax=Pseudomonas monteilii TaxID=76759 RepID=UPI003D97845D
MNFLQRIADRAHERLQNDEQAISLACDSKVFARHVQDIYKVLQSPKYYTFGVQKLCFACEAAVNEPMVIALLEQCINSSRIFLYEEMLRKRLQYAPSAEGFLEVAQKAFYSLESDVILTKEQKDLYDLFLKKRRLVISAPTSFGKSRIVREIISHSSYQCVVMIVPTNALLNETYQAFREDRGLSEYSLVFSTHTEPPEGKAIYIFTPEKFDLYTDEHGIQFDFFVFDEVYKVGNYDGRSSVFSNCLYKAYKRKCDYYLIGPYFKSFSAKYLERTSGHFERYQTDIVQKEIISYFDGGAPTYRKITLPVRAGKDARLKQVLQKIDGPTIVYVGRKDTAETRAKIIHEIKSKALRQKSDSVVELVEYIKKTISTEWRLIDFLQSGVAFHHAGIPKYIQSEIVDLFNAGELDVIVCTPTLTEGVNTTAKNVVFFDTAKADQSLTGFEVKNVVGRSGRFGQHFVGRAVFLEPHAEQDDIEEISFPIFDSENLREEDNIQISLDDLNDAGRNQRGRINNLAGSLMIPLEVLKKNKYVSLDNQIRLIMHLRENPSIRRELLGAHNPPRKEQVDLIIHLVHDFLYSDSDKRDSWSTGNISRFVKYHVYHSPSIKQLIREHHAVKEDTRIRNVLDLIYTYFEYSLPKYISALENIVNFVYSEKISFALFVTKLQYGSTEPQDILLADAGIPRSIIIQVSGSLSGATTIESIKDRLSRNPGILSRLSGIEARMLKKRI